MSWDGIVGPPNYSRSYKENDMIVPLPMERQIGNHTQTKGKVKIGVYGSYKKGFHNHEMLGTDAVFLGLSKINGVMYLVEMGDKQFPLFYINSIRKTMERDYILELYEIDAIDFGKIQSKELRENGMRIDLDIDKQTYICFVTNPKDKTEPAADTYIKAFNKLKFEAYIGGDVTIYALDKETAEKKLQEMFDDAANVLEREKHEDAAIVLRELIPYLGNAKDGPPEDQEEIVTAGA